MGIRKPDRDLWTPIESTLNVSEPVLEAGAGRAKVNDLGVLVARICEQNVLWLQITVDDAELG